MNDKELIHDLEARLQKAESANTALSEKLFAAQKQLEQYHKLTDDSLASEGSQKGDN